MKVMIALLLTGGVLLAGCSKKEDAPAEATAAATDSTGVKECDDYFKKMEPCTAKAPDAQKATMKSTMTQMREAFKTMGTAPGGKDQLKKQCQEHAELLAKTCP